MDKREYMREYMRKRRARRPDGVSVRQFESRCRVFGERGGKPQMNHVDRFSASGARIGRPRSGWKYPKRFTVSFTYEEFIALNDLAVFNGVSAAEAVRQAVAAAVRRRKGGE